MFKYTLDNKRYHTLNYHYKTKFNEKIMKISLNLLKNLIIKVLNK